MRAPRTAAAVALLLALVLPSGCAEDAPPTVTRVSGWSPQGEGVATSSAATIELSGGAAPEGLLDGRRVALASAPQARAATTAVGSADGLTAATPVVPCDVTLSADGRRITLTPRAPLASGLVHTILLGPILDRDGKPVLDPEGRRRTFAATFKTAPQAGPPPRPVLTEALAAAATPQAGGEYVEVQNRGDGPLDLTGWRLEKTTPAGAWSGGDLLPVALAGPVAPGGFALLTGEAWDDRYALQGSLVRATAGAGALLGGLADDRPVALRLLDPDGAVRSALGAGGALRCSGAVALIDPDAGDLPANLACETGVGTPGTCNEVTPATRCR